MQIKKNDPVYLKSQKLVNKAIDKLFKKLHKWAKTESGDITPQQSERLDQIKFNLAVWKTLLTKLAAEQVQQNLPEPDDDFIIV